MSEVDRLVEIITQRVKERMDARTGVAAPASPAPAVASAAKLALAPKDRGDCTDDSAPGEDCAGCGACVVRRPWSVRAAEGAGAAPVAALLA